MKRLFRYVLLLTLMVFVAETALAQKQNIRQQHEVKRKETIFGISRMYGITIQELINANPVMNTPGYELKKGDVINIPWPANQPQSDQPQQPTAVTEQPTPSSQTTKVEKTDVRNREIRVGIMLPLHKVNGDGKRMIEYYRGVLMACDSLRANGISTDIRAWNVAEDSDIRTFLEDPKAAECDVIIGPLYSKMVKPLSDFATDNDIRLFIPFSINTHETLVNRNIFQVYQAHSEQNELFISHFMDSFSDTHPVFIDCNDTTSQKGIFTFGLRRRLEAKDIAYKITNLNSSEAAFFKSFDVNKRNMVILNTARSKELNAAMAKLNGLRLSHPELQISVFGYTEWMLLTRHQLENFYKFDTYIPATFHTDLQSPRTKRFQTKYRWNFHSDLMNSLPRFAITGFDHAYFLLKGLHIYGKNFTGAAGIVGYKPIQTPLHFERLGNGGLQNRAVVFVHYLPEKKTETITF
ncbi:MAG: LysM peptidoglycan-binding domain-containing protein [Prevotella sp.]|nr:LysM peptidoglycan-binding domain-containing protein [Prevotella sp.]